MVPEPPLRKPILNRGYQAIPSQLSRNPGLPEAPNPYETVYYNIVFHSFDEMGFEY